MELIKLDRQTNTDKYMYSDYMINITDYFKSV